MTKQATMLIQRHNDLKLINLGNRFRTEENSFSHKVIINK